MAILGSIITTLTFFLMPAPTTLYGADLTPVVTLPAGYFVMQSESDAPDGFISVAYDDLFGYVRADSVTAVDYRPITKYETTARFKCDNDGQPVNLRAAPSKSAEILTVLGSSAEGRLYGEIQGDALIQGAGDIWYFVSYEGVRGYCYCAHVSADPIPPNIIEKEPEPETPTTTEPSDEPPQSMSTVAAIIFIVALCIPVPFIMFYLFRKPKDNA